MGLMGELFEKKGHVWAERGHSRAKSRQLFGKEGACLLLKEWGAFSGLEKKEPGLREIGERVLQACWWGGERYIYFFLPEGFFFLERNLRGLERGTYWWCGKRRRSAVRSWLTFFAWREHSRYDYSWAPCFSFPSWLTLILIIPSGYLVCWLVWILEATHFALWDSGYACSIFRFTLDVFYFSWRHLMLCSFP